MSGYTERMSQRLPIVATIDPQDFTAGTSTTTLSTDVIDMSKYRRVAFLIAVGTLGTACTVDFTAYKGTVTATVTTSVTAITQLTTADDNNQVWVEIEAEDLGPTNRYVKGALVLTNGGAADNEGVAVIALADVGRYGPASDGDLATVDEIVVS